MISRETSKHLIEKHTEIYCPITGCDGHFPPPWRQYECGVNDKGMPIYKCPVCNKTFTADDMPVNAVKVEWLSETNFMWFDTKTKKCVFKVHSNNIFTDGESYYVHVPVLILNNPNLRMFSADDTFTTEEVEKAFVVFINSLKTQFKASLKAQAKAKTPR